MPDLTNDYIKSQKPWIKMAMKGKTMWFGVQATGMKEGIFKVSKKKGEVTDKNILANEPFDQKGKAEKEGKKANTEGIANTMFGKCEGDLKTGVLKLAIEKGQLKETHLKFTRYFIATVCKLKMVKEVVSGAVVGNVDENAKLEPAPTAASVTARVATLREKLKAAGGNADITKRLDAAEGLSQTNPEGADDELDVLQGEIDQLAAKGGGGTAVNAKLAPARQSWKSASDAVDKQVEAIKAAILKENDDQLRDIANFGLTGIDGGFRFKLNTALTEVEKASDPAARKKASAAAQAAMKELLKHVNGDDRVKVLADPPNGWPKVTFKDTINPALTELAKALTDK
jgi:hypothetical protein